MPLLIVCVFRLLLLEIQPSPLSLAFSQQHCLHHFVVCVFLSFHSHRHLCTDYKPPPPAPVPSPPTIVMPTVAPRLAAQPTMSISLSPAAAAAAAAAAVVAAGKPRVAPSTPTTTPATATSTPTMARFPPAPAVFPPGLFHPTSPYMPGGPHLVRSPAPPPYVGTAGHDASPSAPVPAPLGPGGVPAPFFPAGFAFPPPAGAALGPLRSPPLASSAFYRPFGAPVAAAPTAAPAPSPAAAAAFVSAALGSSTSSVPSPTPPPAGAPVVPLPMGLPSQGMSAAPPPSPAIVAAAAAAAAASAASATPVSPPHSVPPTSMYGNVASPGLSSLFPPGGAQVDGSSPDVQRLTYGYNVTLSGAPPPPLPPPSLPMAGRYPQPSQQVAPTPTGSPSTSFLS